MIKKLLLTMIVMMVLSCSVLSQAPTFRKAIFLHRSVGGNVFGPNGSNTSVPLQCQAYNSAHNYTGADAVSMDEVMFPWNGNSGNAWWEWHRIFDGNDPDDDIYQYINGSTYDIIIIKTCYTVSGLTEGIGLPSDSIHYDWKSVEVFKWHVRSVLEKMEQHPDKFFVIWNLVPLLNDGSFSPSVVANDRLFSVWMKDTLATGLDATYGAFPPNVYIFDIFNYLKNPTDNYINTAYTVSSSDNHLNALGTQLLAPLFVEQLFDAAYVYETILPVELISFSGSANTEGIELNWTTATELNNDRFEIQKRVNSNFITIGSVNGHGTSTSKNYYSFTDKNISSGKNIYRLKQIDYDGTFKFSDVLEIDLNTVNNYSLEPNYPNPFNPGTVINFTLAKSGTTTLKVYDNLGSEVATLVDGFMQSGKHSIKFTAKNLQSGVYFYSLKTEKFSDTRKMILIK